MTPHRVRITVNGVPYDRTVESRLTLADFLREDLGLTGTHVGCSHGVCGACTVLVDGASARGCLMLAAQADGATVTTIEGLAAADGTLHPIQQAMHEHHGVQCGFCTAGILMTLVEFFEEEAEPDEDAIREALSGNLCRCTGYQGIVDAVLSVARQGMLGRSV
jgi:aerobic-type carbon monoxide dehydrogenase small subunit (CoxS/CutS family)